MDFAQFCTLFDYKIAELSKRSKQIDESVVEAASKQFAKFAKYDLEEQEELFPFLDNISTYFVLVLRYAQTFKEEAFHECQLTVRTAFHTFMSVLDKTQTYSRIIKRLVKTIDIFIEEYGQFGFIQEILKVYIVCLNNVEQNVVVTLARKHKSLNLLADIARNAHDTCLQAVIIETVFKLSSTETPLLEHIFPEIKSLSADIPNDYQKIRAILEELNKNSNKIFSINCSSITLDHFLVSEFEGANSFNDVWLDVDLPLKRLSFFCTPEFLSSFTATQFGQATNWEVLSFHVGDCLETRFNYNETVENLEIDIKIKIGKFNLFRNLKFDPIRHLVIQISKYSKKYDKFVKVVMPQVFSGFSAEDFACSCDRVVTDDSATPDLFSLTSDEETRNSALDDMLLESISVSNYLTEEEDEITVELSMYDIVKETKVLMGNRQKLVDKSLSSISFSESLHAGKAKISRMNKKRKMSSRQKTEVSANNKRKPNSLKVSTSTIELNSPQIKAKSKKQNAKEAASEEEKIDYYTFDDDDSPDLAVQAQEDLELSQSKVEDWLNSYMPDLKQCQVVLEQMPVPNEGAASTISSNQPLEQVITTWLSEGHYEPSETTKNFLTQRLSGRTASLLETLAKDDDIRTSEIRSIADMDVENETVTKSKRKYIISNDTSEENKENRPINNSVNNAESSNVTLTHWEKESQRHSPVIANVEIIEYGDVSDDSLTIASRQETQIKTKKEKLQKTNGVLSRSNSTSSNTKTIPKKRNKTKQPQKEKKTKNNFQKKNGILSVQASNRDLEDKQHQKGNVSKQLFEYIIDKEVLKTDNLSKPAVGKDTENSSASTGNEEETQRKERFKGTADYLFDKYIASEAKKDTSANNSLSRQPSANSSMGGSKPGKRRLFNPNDLSYLDDMITDDYINSKPEEKVPLDENNNTVPVNENNKIKDSSTEKTPAKRGRKKKVQDLDSSAKKAPAKRGRKKKVQNLELKTKNGTESTFKQVIDEWKVKVKEHKEQVKKQKLLNDDSIKKRRGRKKVVDSSTSTQSSSEQFIPMETLLRKRKSSGTPAETSAKRVKEGDETSQHVKVISNVVIREADTLQPELSNEDLTSSLENLPCQCFCDTFSKHIHYIFLAYINHAKNCNRNVFEEQNFRRILEVIERDILAK